MNQNIGLKMAAARQQLGDPLAPNKLRDAYSATRECGKMFTQSGLCTKAEAQAIMDRLAIGFPDGKLDEQAVASSPAYITALCTMLVNALIRYGTKL